MANYESQCISSSFKVTDEERYNLLTSRLRGEDPEIGEDEGGHYIGGYGNLSYVPPLSVEMESIKKALEESGAIYDRHGKPVEIDKLAEYESVFDKDGNYIADIWDDGDLDAFFKKVQPLLPIGEAIRFTEVGNENLRYVGGWTAYITKEEVLYSSSEGWLDAQEALFKAGISSNRRKSCAVYSWDEFMNILTVIYGGGVDLESLDTNDVCERLSKHFQMKIESFHTEGKDSRTVWLVYCL